MPIKWTTEEMGKFLERYSLQRLNQEETENMNRRITSTEIETVTKKLPTNKRPGTDGFTGKFYQTFREELTPVLQKRFQKSTEEGTLPSSFYNKTMILIQKPKYHRQKKENSMPVSSMNIDAKIPSEIPANRIQQSTERLIHHDQKLSQGCKDFSISTKSIIVTYHKNKPKNKNHMTVSIDTEKPFDKIKYPLKTTTLQKVDTEHTST